MAEGGIPGNQGSIVGNALALAWDVAKDVLGAYGHEFTELARPTVREVLTTGKNPVNHHLLAASHRAVCRAVAVVARDLTASNNLKAGIWRSLAQHLASHHTLAGWGPRLRVDQSLPSGSWLGTLLATMEEEPFRKWHRRELYDKTDIDELFQANPNHPLATPFTEAFLNWVHTGARLGHTAKPAGFDETFRQQPGGLWLLHGMEFREQLKSDETCFRAAVLWIISRPGTSKQPLTDADIARIASDLEHKTGAAWAKCANQWQASLEQWRQQLDTQIAALRQEILDAISKLQDDATIIKEDTRYIRESLDKLKPLAAQLVRPGHVFVKPHQLPPRAAQLFGREKDLPELRRLITQHQRVAVTGAGGLGKTALCAEALHELLNDPDGKALLAGGIFAHDFYKEPSLAAFVAGILRQAKLATDQPEHQPALAALALHQPGVLLYIEGAEKLASLDDLLEFLDGTTRLLLTTRRSAQAEGMEELRVHRLDQSPAAAAIHFYADKRHRTQNHLPHPQPPNARGWTLLAADLGGHPLACRLAGEHCGVLSLDPAALHEELKAKGLRSLAAGDDSKHNLEVLFRKTAEAVVRASPPVAQQRVEGDKEESPPASSAIVAWHCLTLGGTSPVPLSVLRALGLRDQADLKPLLDLGLCWSTQVAGDVPLAPSLSPSGGEGVRRTGEGAAFAPEPAYALTHALLGEWAREGLADFGRPHSLLLARAMKWGREYRNKVQNAACVPGGPARYKVMVPIAENLLREVERIKDLEPATRYVFYHLPARLHSLHAAYLAAEPAYRRGLDAMEQTAGAQAPETPAALTNLASLLQATNRLAEAEPLMRRALAIDQARYGSEHPTIAIDINNLAQLLQDTNRLAEAEPLMRRALAIDEAGYGREHPTVAIRLINLASLLQATNRLAEAEPLMRRALAIDQARYGSEHPTIAININNLAQLLQDTNRLAEAEPLMRRALAIDEAGYGPEHPKVAIRLNNLATLLQATNRLAEAEPLVRRALTIGEASFGPEHPKVAIRLINLASLLQNTNRLAEAEPLMRRALAIDEASFGPEHPEVATDLSNLATLLLATNRLAEAEPLMRRSVLIYLKFNRATGHGHPHLRGALLYYAGLCQETAVPKNEFWPRLFALCREAGLEEGRAQEILRAAFSQQ